MAFNPNNKDEVEKLNNLREMLRKESIAGKSNVGASHLGRYHEVGSAIHEDSRDNTQILLEKNLD